MKRALSPARLFGASVGIGVAACALGCGFPAITYDASDGGPIDVMDAAPLSLGSSVAPGARNNSDVPDARLDGTDDAVSAVLPDADADASATLEDATSAPASDPDASASAAGLDGDLLALDAAPATDVQVPPDSATSSPPPPPPPVCDADNDTYLAEGSVCAGLDCDDNDPRAHPGETQFLTDLPTATTQGDWNCDGVVEKEYPTNVTCSLLDLTDCNTTGGFASDPGCGVADVFVQCEGFGVRLGALCGEGPLTVVVQGCR